MAYGRTRAPASLRRGLTAVIGLLCAGAFSSGVLAASTETPRHNKDWDLCRTAAQKVERASDVPHALLQAMSLVETGRRGPDGKHTAWPWTINSHGKGYRFATKEDAIWAVRRLVADGARSIDIGCMQVNLRYHPRAFTSLEEAFDPAANMAYAASFLTRLKERHGSWRAASARYHSYNPKLREKYASRVDKTLARERKLLAAATPARPTPLVATEPYVEAGNGPFVTASVQPQDDTVGLGLRPTLLPGLRRGLDIAPDDITSEDKAPKNTSLPIEPEEAARQMAAR